MQATSEYKGPIDCVKKVYAQGGIRSLFCGTIATAFRDGLGCAFYFITYEWLKTLAFKFNADPNHIALISFAGGIVGFSYWAVANPGNMITSHLQIASRDKYPKGAKVVLTTMTKKEGYDIIYRGGVPIMNRAFPANVVCFFGYDLAVKSINSLL